MLATFAFDVCHDVYRAAREAIDTRVATLNAESSGKYQWRPDRMPRLAEYVCDFARAGERVLGFNSVEGQIRGRQAAYRELGANPPEKSIRASRMVMFRIYYLGGAEYQAARRHLGISELNWTDWAEEIRRDVGRELTRTGVFPPSKYFRERAAKAS
jgi:hypothetical protein